MGDVRVDIAHVNLVDVGEKTRLDVKLKQVDNGRWKWESEAEVSCCAGRRPRGRVYEM